MKPEAILPKENIKQEMSAVKFIMQGPPAFPHLKYGLQISLS